MMITRYQQEKQVKELINLVEDVRYKSYGYMDYIDDLVWCKKSKVDVQMERWLRGEY